MTRHKQITPTSCSAPSAPSNPTARSVSTAATKTTWRAGSRRSSSAPLPRHPNRNTSRPSSAGLLCHRLNTSHTTTIPTAVPESGRESSRDETVIMSTLVSLGTAYSFSHDFYSYLTHILNLIIEGRKGYQPKKLPRAPINDIAEELRHRSLSESPRPLVIADPGATVPVNGSHHSGEHSPPQVPTFHGHRKCT